MGETIKKIKTFYLKTIDFPYQRHVKGIILASLGFFMGRCTLVSMHPLAIPFLASFLFLGNGFYLGMIATLLGLLTKFNVASSMGYIVAVFILFMLHQVFRKKIINRKTSPLHSIFAGISLFIGGGFVAIFIFQSKYQFIMVLAESVFAICITTIFKKGIITLLREEAFSVDPEDVLAIFLMIAGIIAATVDVHLGIISLRLCLSTFFILLGSFYGGAAIGTMAAVLLGICIYFLGFEDINFVMIIALSAMLAGGLKTYPKMVVFFTYILAYMGFSFVFNMKLLTFPMICSLSLGGFFFMFCPKDFILQIKSPTRSMNRYVAGIEYMIRAPMEDLAQSFYAISAEMEKEETFQIDKEKIFKRVKINTCNRCSQVKNCYETNRKILFHGLDGIFNYIKIQGSLPKDHLPKPFELLCIQPTVFLEMFYKAYDEEALEVTYKERMRKKDVWLQKQILATGENIEKFSQKTYTYHMDKESLLAEKLDLEKIEYVDIFIRKEKRWILTISFSHKMTDIEPILKISKDILGKDFKTGKNWQDGKLFFYEILETPPLYLEIAMAADTKRESDISGDSFIETEISVDSHLIALSDGMGSGPLAQAESQKTLHLLQRVMKANFDAKTAVSFVNQTLLSYEKEFFATMDICLVDLYGYIEFTKVGTAPSFFNHQGKLELLESQALPVGIVEQIDPLSEKRRLFAGDYFLLCSDGFYEVIKGASKEKEKWVERQLGQLSHLSCEDICNAMLHELKKQAGFYLSDDVTIIFGKIGASF